MAVRNKYGAKKVVYDGIIFDSIKEKDRYAKLLILKRAKEPSRRVVDIVLQKKYDVHVNGIKVFYYKLDFEVTYADGRIEYEDVKGCRVGCAYQLFKLKKKCVEAEYGITITEV